VFRKAVKTIWLQGLRSAGVQHLAARSKARQKRLLILCYHGLSLRDEHSWHPHLYVTPDFFRQRMTSLRKMGANVLELSEALSGLKAGTLPPRSVVLTFDDGFADFGIHASPILREFRYPCTLYLTSYYAERPLPIINLVLNYLLWKSKQPSFRLPQFGFSEARSIQSYAERTQMVLDLVGRFDAEQLSTSEKDQVARQIAETFGIEYEDLLQTRMFQIMTPEEIASCSKQGTSIQLHSHRHRSPRIRELFLEELELNRNKIRQWTNTEPTHFCYPSGVYADQFLPWLHELGIESATTCTRALARKDERPLLLPRVLDDSTMSQVQFEASVAGLLA
jgi:peptidoglycan/xylan/chitin deacetylase (PgdA/CDA1 family)